jgi:hypothetical protein
MYLYLFSVTFKCHYVAFYITTVKDYYNYFLLINIYYFNITTTCTFDGLPKKRSIFWFKFLYDNVIFLRHHIYGIKVLLIEKKKNLSIALTIFFLLHLLHTEGDIHSSSLIFTYSNRHSILLCYCVPKLRKWWAINDFWIKSLQFRFG